MELTELEQAKRLAVFADPGLPEEYRPPGLYDDRCGD